MYVQVRQFPENKIIPIRDERIEENLNLFKVIGPALVAIGTIAFVFSMAALAAHRTPNVSGALKSFTKIPAYGVPLLAFFGLGFAFIGSACIGAYADWKGSTKKRDALLKDQVELLQKAVKEKEANLEKIENEFQAIFSEVATNEGRAKVLEQRDMLSPSYRAKFAEWKKEQLERTYFQYSKELTLHGKALEGLKRRLAHLDSASDEGKALKAFMEEHGNINGKEKLKVFGARVESAIDQVSEMIEKFVEEGVAHEKVYLDAFRRQEKAFTDKCKTYKQNRTVLNKRDEEFIRRLDTVLAQLNFRDEKTFQWLNLADLYDIGLNSKVPKSGSPFEYQVSLGLLKAKMEQVLVRMASLTSELEAR
jgi:hypothetical protein